MTNTHRKMLFILIVGIAAEICTLALWKYYGETVCITLTGIFSLTALYCSAIVILGPNLPQRNTLIILLILLIAPIGLLAKDFITYYSMSSYEFITMYETMSKSPLTYSEIAALYLPMGATFTALISLYYESIIPYTPNEPTMICPQCRKAISKHESFCPYCHTLSPEVRKSIDAFPNKKFLDFTANPDGEHLRCPHCNNFLALSNANTRSEKRFSYRKLNYHWRPGTPIQSCIACHHFLLAPNYREWVFLSKAERIRLLCTPDFFSLLSILCVSSAAAEYGNKLIAVVGLAVSIVLSVIWIQICTQGIIEKSRQRVKNNPDYPKILKHMGYEDSLKRKLF